MNPEPTVLLHSKVPVSLLVCYLIKRESAACLIKSILSVRKFQMK